MIRVQWSQIRLEAGDQSCPIHGPIEPADGLIPHCPHDVDGRPCLHPAYATVEQSGHLVQREPAPAECGVGHRLTADQMTVGTRPCQCTPVGHHRTWQCVTCGDVQVWPPHVER